MVQVDRTVKQNIPLGFNIHNEKIVDFTDELNKLWAAKGAVNFEKVSRSIGTLGGGNHFIEIDKDDEDCFYLVIHTGSRNFGKTIAEYYQDKAIEYHRNLLGASVKEVIDDLKARGLQSQISKVLAERGEIKHEELCYLEGSLFESYLNDMKIAQYFASHNRKTIADILCRCLHIAPIEQFETVHNYINTEKKILRKGAISAEAGEKCLIPINMHDGSLICIGKGNDDFNCSAPHGAGRLMSRKEAKRTLSLDEFKETMKDVYSSTVNGSTLDEAPKAYKPIAEILENVKETVDVVTQIKPIYNIKAEE
jgi:RNA-splicing ligase RtcB